MSARIYRFPKTFRRHAPPAVPLCFASRRRSWVKSGGFALLFGLTLAASFFYLSGVANATRHGTLYAALLAAVWGGYFIHDKLLTTRLGPLLRLADQFLVAASVAGFFVFVYWIVLTHP